jgi:glycosyltransferase involved in cell wall biosynthesis
MLIFQIILFLLKHGGNIMIEEVTLDTIVRFHDVRRLPELERCIFSLVSQSYRPLNIILVLQRFSAEEIAATRLALEPLIEDSNALTLSIYNWEKTEPADARTFLLNKGISVSTGRFLAFLDYDDILFPEAYELVISHLQKSQAAIAFASVQLMRLHVYENFFYTESKLPPFKGKNLWDLFCHNFCPLHSYVLDRHKIPSHVLYFDTSLVIEEDYDLLLRICAQFKSDFSLLDTPVGYYFFKTDGSNTVATEKLNLEKQIIYNNVCARIESRRRSTRVTLPVQEVLGISNPNDQLTIHDVLNEHLNMSFSKWNCDISGNRIKLIVKQLFPTFFLLGPKPMSIVHLRQTKAIIKKIYVVYRREGLAGLKRRIRFLLNIREPDQSLL